MTQDFFTIIFLASCILVSVRSLYDLAFFLLSLGWLRKARHLKGSTEKLFVIIIPVLREQQVLRSTVEWFLRLNYLTSKVNIVLVTTEKEFYEKHVSHEKTDTIQLASSLEREYPGLIRHLHYPHIDGKMVDQVNYAFTKVLDESSRKNDDDVFLALYNADSRPHLDTLQWVSSLAAVSDGRVFQQSSVFFDNFKSLSRGNGLLSTRLLQANAVLQTRWTLAHEIPRLLRQTFLLTRFKTRQFLTHCVGHGLFLRRDIVRELRGMPTGTMTEDLSFGFILSLLGEPIRPIPVLESAEMPNSIVGALRQKYVWFFGPMDHVAYARSFLKHYAERASRWLVGWFVIQGLLPALAWLVAGWILLYIITFPIFTGSISYYVLGWGNALFYLFTFFLTTLNIGFLNRLSFRKESINFGEALGALLFIFPMILLHSLPPLVSVLAKVQFALTGRDPVKPKTER